MEDKTKNEKYLKGYNSGYTIAKYAPELSSRIIQTERSAAYLEGFIDAHHSYQIEKESSKDKFPIAEKDLPSWLRLDEGLTETFNEASMDKTVQKDKDKEIDREPDI